MVEIFASIISALAHDVGHPGTTNPFQIAFETELSTTYNDVSVLESHHLALMWGLLRSSEFSGLLAPLNQQQRKVFRDTTVRAILATDMARHAKNMSDLRLTLEEDPQIMHKPWDDEFKIMMISMGIHVSDLGNPAKPIDQAVRWATLVMEEFFQQGDQERKAGMPISPNCDKNTVEKATCQFMFISFVIQPLFENWSQILDSSKVCLANCIEVKEFWGKKRQAQPKKARVSEPTSPLVTPNVDNPDDDDKLLVTRVNSLEPSDI